MHVSTTATHAKHRQLARLVLLCVAYAMATTCGVEAIRDVSALNADQSLPAPHDLSVEYLSQPLAVNTLTPRFAWRISSLASLLKQRGLSYTAYQIQVVSVEQSPDGQPAGTKMWDTGKAMVGSSTYVRYGGLKLEASTTYQWRVKWWASTGDESDFSPWQQFTTGLLADIDWHGAAWLGSPGINLFRTELNVKTEGLQRAYAYVAAPGCHFLQVEGQAVGDQHGICSWLQFDKTLHYQAHNITSHISSGKEAIGVALGNGFWVSQGYAKYPIVRIKIEMVYTDGTRSIVVSKPQSQGWMQSSGYITASDPWKGTRIDWSQYEPDWSKSSFKPSSRWTSAKAADDVPVSNVLRSLAIPTVEEGLTQPAKNVSRLTNGHFVVDFGVNLVGLSRLRLGSQLKHLTNGSITLKHGETLYPNGSVNTDFAGQDPNNFQKDIHYFSSSDVSNVPATLEPAFSFHGFQYAEVIVEGPQSSQFELKPDMIEGFWLHPSVNENGHIYFHDDGIKAPIGGPSSDASMLNQLFDIIRRSQLANIAAYTPTDCPTREKHGWLGDAQVTAEEALYNLDMASIYEQFVNTITMAQMTSGDVPGVVPSKGHATKPANASSSSSFAMSLNDKGITDISWTAAYVLIPTWVYHYYGDISLFETYYDDIKRFVDNLNSHAQGEPGKLADFWTWGDWCAVQARSICIPTTGPELAAFNWILSLDAMANVAQALNKTEDAAAYTKIAQEARPAFHSRFYNQTAGLYNGGYLLDAQSLTSAPFVLGNTIPSAMAPDVLDKLVAAIHERDDHLTYGSVGAKHVLPMLTAAGRFDLAMQIVTQKSFPGYGHWLELGATTCWENWSGFNDSSHPPPPTHNHIFLCGGLGEWMYRSVAGIEPTAPGYANVSIAPHVLPTAGPGGLTAFVNSPRGNVSVQWMRKVLSNDEASVQLDAMIPVGVNGAMVRVPFAGIDSEHFSVQESGKVVWAPPGTFHPVEGISAAHADEQGVWFSVATGLYAFASSKSS